MTHTEVAATEVSSQREGGFRMLLAALAILTGLQLSQPAMRWDPAIPGVGAILALVVALWHVHRRPLTFWIGIMLMLLAMGGGALLSERSLDGVSGSPFHAPFFVFFAGIVLNQVLTAERVTEDTVLGSACAYLLLALAFASAYEAVLFFDPTAIKGIEIGSGLSAFAQLSYFSLVTLTTLGYGDFSPVHPFCQSLAIVQTVIGAMFPALVVARIIAVYASGSDARFAEPEPVLTREAIVARVLFLSLPAAVLALPWIEQGSFGRFAVSAILTVLLIAGVYFVSGQRRILVAGIVLGLTAEILRVGDWGLIQLATTIEVVFIGIVVVRMSIWCLQQQRATTSVILASVCLYWLIGLGWSGVYQFIENQAPDTLAPAHGESVGGMLYFSFMTLTTTGYGDFVPVHHVTRALASLEAFVGVFYPAIVIARLVSLYGSQD